MNAKRLYSLGAMFILVLIVGGIPLISAIAQGEPTPLPINLPTQTGQSVTPLATITVTKLVPNLAATGTPGVVVEVRDKVVPGNVRSSPNTESSIIGKIVPGKFYPVISRSYDWLQILYGSPLPETTGWVYKEIVVVTGDLRTVPTTADKDVPTPDVPTVQAGQTFTAQAASVIGTPGGFGSATSARSSATGVFIRTQEKVAVQSTGSGPLPTFTYPPPYVEATLAPRSSGATRAGLPPVVPIIALAAIGLFGLFISSLRRL